MPTLDVLASLHRLGWPAAVREDTAVRAFQRSFGLVVDGIVGPATTGALRTALARHAAGKPTLTAHFDLREFACQCRGKYAAHGCAGILVVPALVTGLQDLRVNVIGGPLALAGAYRCPRHNTSQGGATASQHQYGAAADLQPRIRTTTVRTRRTFSGLGSTTTGLVRHVDVRHASGTNPTGSSPDLPAQWTYPA